MRAAGHGNARNPGFGPLRIPVQRANVIDWDAEEKRREVNLRGQARRKRLETVLQSGHSVEATLRELVEEDKRVIISSIISPPQQGFQVEQFRFTQPSSCR